MPRYVIQQHDRQGEARHWDLMLEVGPVLKTYRLARAPACGAFGPICAQPIADHPPRFLDYEGPVHQGLGSVLMLDQGTYQTVTCSEDLWVLDLAGRVCIGRFQLALAQGAAWTFSRVEST